MIHISKVCQNYCCVLGTYCSLLVKIIYCQHFLSYFYLWLAKKPTLYKYFSFFFLGKSISSTTITIKVLLKLAPEHSESGMIKKITFSISHVKFIHQIGSIICRDLLLWGLISFVNLAGRKKMNEKLVKSFCN